MLHLRPSAFKSMERECFRMAQNDAAQPRSEQAEQGQRPPGTGGSGHAHVDFGRQRRHDAGSRAKGTKLRFTPARARARR